MSLTDLQRRSARRLTEVFGEPITYVPKAEPDNPLSINGYVRRNPPQRQGEDDGRSSSNPIELFIARPDLESVDTRGDRVRLKPREDSPGPELMAVTSILKQDPGGWWLAVGR